MGRIRNSFFEHRTSSKSIKHQRKALSFLYQLATSDMVGCCCFAIFCGRHCSPLRLFTSPSGRSRRSAAWRDVLEFWWFSSIEIIASNYWERPQPVQTSITFWYYWNYWNYRNYWNYWNHWNHWYSRISSRSIVAYAHMCVLLSQCIPRWSYRMGRNCTHHLS